MNTKQLLLFLLEQLLEDNPKGVKPKVTNKIANPRHHILSVSDQKQIKKLYRTTKISQRQLGVKFGVTQQTISEVLNKR